MTPWVPTELQAGQAEDSDPVPAPGGTQLEADMETDAQPRGDEDLDLMV